MFFTVSEQGNRLPLSNRYRFFLRDDIFSLFYFGSCLKQNKHTNETFRRAAWEIPGNIAVFALFIFFS